MCGCNCISRLAGLCLAAFSLWRLFKMPMTNLIKRWSRMPSFDSLLCVCGLTSSDRRTRWSTRRRARAWLIHSCSNRPGHTGRWLHFIPPPTILPNSKHITRRRPVSPLSLITHPINQPAASFTPICLLPVPPRCNPTRMKCLRPSTLYCSLWMEAKRFRSNHNVRFVLLFNTFYSRETPNILKGLHVIHLKKRKMQW